MHEPFALELYRRFQKGETVQQLSAELQISAERIEQRLKAAAVYLKRQQQSR